jgi:hypothetical protein
MAPQISDANASLTATHTLSAMNSHWDQRSSSTVSNSRVRTLRIALGATAAVALLGGGAYALTRDSGGPNPVIVGSNEGTTDRSATDIGVTDINNSDPITATSMAVETTPYTTAAQGDSNVNTVAPAPDDNLQEGPTTTAGPDWRSEEDKDPTPSPSNPSTSSIGVTAPTANSKPVVVGPINSVQLGTTRAELAMAPDRRLYLLNVRRAADDAITGVTIDWFDTNSGESTTTTLQPDLADAIVGPSQILYRVTETGVEAVPALGGRAGDLVAETTRPAGSACANGETGIVCDRIEVMPWVNASGRPLQVIFSRDRQSDWFANAGEVTMNGNDVAFPSDARFTMANARTALGVDNDTQLVVSHFHDRATMHCAMITAAQERPQLSVIGCVSNKGGSWSYRIPAGLETVTGGPLRYLADQFVWQVEGTADQPVLVRYTLP